MANSKFTLSHQTEDAKHLARETATSPGMKALARFGYAAKGIVYLIIGALAAKLAAGAPNQTPDRNGAIHLIADQPFGKVLLGIVTVGFFSYALWSAIQAVFDPDHTGTDTKAILQRIGHAVIACSYVALGVGALLLVLGSGNSGKDSNASTQSWTARLLSAPFGVALVVIVGLIVVGVACVLFYRVYKADFRQSLHLASLRPQIQKVIIFIGRFGYAAQAVVFTIIGIFLIVAALQHNPSQAKGLDGALQELTRQPFGQALLALVAVGLIAFGIYSLVEARYRNLGSA